MSVTYYFGTSGVLDPDTKATTLNNKINIDLDLPTATSVSNNGLTNQLEVVYATGLTEYNYRILSSLVDIIFYGAIVNRGVYVEKQSNFSRRSYDTSSSPTADHDDISGYYFGSIVLTSNGTLYTCTDNTTGAAQWNAVPKYVPLFSSSFGNSSIGYFSVSALSTPTTVTSFPYLGSNNVSPITSVVLVLSMSLSSTGSYSLEDPSSNVIASGNWSSGSSSSPILVTNTTISNVPSSNSIIYLIVTKTAGLGDVNVHSLVIY